MKTEHVTDDETVVEHRLHCNQCALLRINGVVCHEIGCPNAGSRFDVERDDWVKQRKCGICGYRVDHDDPCCMANNMEEEEDGD